LTGLPKRKRRPSILPVYLRINKSVKRKKERYAKLKNKLSMYTLYALLRRIRPSSEENSSFK
jgi:hypothetical protein